MTATTGSLHTRDNGLTAARLMLALMVVVSHSFTLTGLTEPLVAETGQISLGIIAVLGFFGLSGYLVTASRDRLSVGPFLRNRALRIFPGYWLALVFGAIAAIVGAALVHQRVAPADAVGYVVLNLALFPVVETLPPAFDGEWVNGSLWTLGIEAVCYVVLALTPRRWLRPVALGLVPALLAVYAVREGFELQLGLAFLAGSCAYLLRIPVTVLGTIAAVAIAVAGYALHLTPLAGMAVGFAALGLAKLPIRWERDVSYGVYVFAYPIGQVLGATVIATLGVGAMAAGTIALVLPLAWLSWTLVESRAMRLRSRGVTIDQTTTRLASAAP